MPLSRMFRIIYIKPLPIPSTFGAAVFLNLKGIWLQNGLLGFFFPLKSSNLQGIVVVEKTQISEQYFPAIQKFTVLDLGMVLLPVANQMEASCLIIQLVSTDSCSTIAMACRLSADLCGSFTLAAALAFISS